MSTPIGLTYDELTRRARRVALRTLVARWEENELECTRYCANGHPVRLGARPRCKACAELRGEVRA